jgi:hypothetical protein
VLIAAKPYIHTVVVIPPSRHTFKRLVSLKLYLYSIIIHIMARNRIGAEGKKEIATLSVLFFTLCLVLKVFLNLL